jgi:hypothetical protein
MDIVMNTKLLLPLIAAMTLASAGAAFAGVTQEQVRGSAVADQVRADQVIVVTDATRYVNVTGGSTVRFVVGDRSFTWCFQNGTANVNPFDLGLIAPKGLLTHPVTTYVADNPLYHNS